MSGNTAYVIGHLTVEDPEKWAEYRSRVPATLAPWNAELVFRGRLVGVLCGEHGYAETVVVRFPGAAAITGWYRAAACQALIALRQQAADLVLISHET